MIGNVTAEYRYTERKLVGRDCGNNAMPLPARGTGCSKYWNRAATGSIAAAQYFIIKTESAS
jgi:hypothetical protein